MFRRPLLAGNWKMHKTVPEALALVDGLKKALPADRDVLICPPFTALSAVSSALKGFSIFLGGQNMNDNLQGAFTGEISALMLKDAGCTHVIIGHSERRQFFGETDALANKKSRLALAEGLIPVLCVGETLDQREKGNTMSVVENQVREGLSGFSSTQAEKTVIAYEPVWAIGTGKTATPVQAQEVHIFIRKILGEAFGEVSSRMRILYGGSVKPDNIDSLMEQPDIDGGLVGGACLKAEDFLRIVKFKSPAENAL